MITDINSTCTNSGGRPMDITRMMEAIKRVPPYRRVDKIYTSEKMYETARKLCTEPGTDPDRAMIDRFMGIPFIKNDWMPEGVIAVMVINDGKERNYANFFQAPEMILVVTEEWQKKMDARKAEAAAAAK